MASFLQVGNRWINLEQVTTVDITTDNQPVPTPVAARVYFGGSYKDFPIQSDAVAIANFLENHRAK